MSTWDSRANKDTWQGTPWHAHHIAERYGLLVIITLGEGILGTITAVAAVVDHVGWSMEAVLLVVGRSRADVRAVVVLLHHPVGGCAGPAPQPEVVLVVCPHRTLPGQWPQSAPGCMWPPTRPRAWP